MQVIHLNYPRILASLVLAVCVLLAGCSGLVMPTAFATHQAPTIFIPTGTLRPSETSTPTEVASVMQGTPIPAPPAPITAADAGKLKRLVRWGKGIPLAMAWSYDQKTLLVGTTAGLGFFDAGSLAEQRFIERNLAVRSVAYSPTGKQMAIGFQDGSVEVWDSACTNLIKNFKGRGQPAVALAFSQDGNRLAASLWNKSVLQFEISKVNNPQPLVEAGKTISGFKGPVTGMTYNRDHSMLYTYQPGLPIFIMNTSKPGLNNQINVASDASGSQPLNAAFSPDLTWFAGNYGATINIQRLSDGITTTTLGPFPEAMSAVIFSPDSTLLAAASNSTINVWQTADYAQVKSFTIPGPGEAVHFLAFSPDGKSLAAFSDTLRVWLMSADSPTEAKSTGFINGYRGAFSFTSDSLGVILAQLDGSVRVYGMPDGAVKSSLSLPNLGSKGVTISHDHSLVAAMSGNKAYVWKTADGSPVAEMDGQRAMNGGLAFSPDDKYLASPGLDKTIVVWRLADQTILGTVACPDVAWNVAFSPDGALLAAIANGVISIFQLSDGQMRYQVNGYSLAFSADGKTLAVAWGNYDNSMITLYNSADGKAKKGFVSDGGSLAFSPDGKLLAVGGNSLVLLQTSDGKLVKSLENPAPYGPLEFSPDGKFLGTTGWDGRIFLWGEE